MISGIDRERPCLHGLAACHVGIRRRVDPVPARREGCRHLIRQRAGRDDGGDLARFICRDSKLSRLAARRAGHFALLQIRLRIAFDEVHTNGCADRGRARGNRHRPCVGIDLSLVLRFDGDGFVCFDRAVLHMRIRLVIHPVQADLARAGEALRRTAAARRDIQDFFLVFRANGERFLCICMTAQRKARPIHIGFIVRRDGIVHEAPRERRPGIGVKVRSDGCRRRGDRAVIQTIDPERIRRD